MAGQAGKLASWLKKERNKEKGRGQEEGSKQAKGRNNSKAAPKKCPRLLARRAFFFIPLYARSIRSALTKEPSLFFF
jgi:hypothetical protein